MAESPILSPTSSVLSVRLNAEERTLLEAAAETAQTTLSDFVRRKAVAAAEAELLNRATITIPAQDWERFEAWLQRPAKPIPALKKLARTTPTWER
jgi:uncharacterized protein (DUF1778 family)